MLGLMIDNFNRTYFYYENYSLKKKVGRRGNTVDTFFINSNSQYAQESRMHSEQELLVSKQWVF